MKKNFLYRNSAISMRETSAGERTKRGGGVETRREEEGVMRYKNKTQYQRRGWGRNTGETAAETAPVRGRGGAPAPVRGRGGTTTR
jgi:hypothetical protein